MKLFHSSDVSGNFYLIDQRETYQRDFCLDWSQFGDQLWWVLYHNSEKYNQWKWNWKLDLHDFKTGINWKCIMKKYSVHVKTHRYRLICQYVQCHRRILWNFMMRKRISISYGMFDFWINFMCGCKLVISLIFYFHLLVAFVLFLVNSM